MKLRKVPEWVKEKFDRWADPILVVLLGVLFVFFILVMVFECVQDFASWLVGYTKKPDILKFLGIGMGGILLALQAKASYRRAKAMEHSARAQADSAKAQADSAKAQADATREQARSIDATEQGQRQERLKNAIEHLGHKSDSVRLGGAYELFHLAEDTEALRKTALDILCAHIRRTTGEAGYQEQYKAKPSEEVQSLLTLLFVQDHQVFKGLQANLQGSFLNGADLNKAHLKGANLRGSHLQGAILMEAHLPRANLHRAHLQGALLMEAHLEEANLHRAHLHGANLWKAHLLGADLVEACLQWANLWRAHLEGADLVKAYLQGAVLWGAHLEGANLVEAYLQGATLRGAHLDEARLSGADLRGAGKYRVTATKSFADIMNELIGRESDLSKAFSFGGLSQEDVDSLVKVLSDEKANELRSDLQLHVGQPPTTGDLPKDCGAKLGFYIKEEADRWIAEYNKAMSEVPKKQ